MKSILVTVGALPALPLILLVLLVLSVSPEGSWPRRIRGSILDWMDRLSNEHGPQLIYLDSPVHRESPEERSVQDRTALSSVDHQACAAEVVKGPQVSLYIVRAKKGSVAASAEPPTPQRG